MTSQTLPTSEAILALGGAFNPVHTGHIAMMNLAKKVIEAERSYTVVAGYLAVAPEGYTLMKLKDQAIKAEHRLAMCNLAIADHEWFVSCERTHGSARECAQRYRDHDDIKVFIALGADRAMKRPENAKWRFAPFDGTVTVCVGRAGETQRVLEAYHADLEANLVPDPDAFLFITQAVNAVSSSLVRERLQTLHDATEDQEKRRVAQEMVEAGYLHRQVAEYILEHERDLYVD